MFIEAIGGSVVKNPHANAGDTGDEGSIPGWGRSQKWHSTPVLLPGKILWAEEPGGLQSMGWQRVRHNWACTYWAIPHRQRFKKSYLKMVELDKKCVRYWNRKILSINFPAWLVLWEARNKRERKEAIRRERYRVYGWGRGGFWISIVYYPNTVYLNISFQLLRIKYLFNKLINM